MLSNKIINNPIVSLDYNTLNKNANPKNIIKPKIMFGGYEPSIIYG